MIMKRSLLSTVCIVLALFRVSVVVAGAQQPKTPETSATPAPASPATQAPITRFDRLAVAKTIYIKNNANNEIPYNVISTSVESWGRYTIVDDPDKAEIVMQISMTGEEGIKVTESNKTSMHSGRPGQQDQSQSKKEVSTEPVDIKVTIFDKNNC